MRKDELKREYPKDITVDYGRQGKQERETDPIPTEIPDPNMKFITAIMRKLRGAGKPVTPKLFLQTALQLSKTKKERIRMGNFRDRHWSYIYNMLPGFRFTEEKVRKKFIDNMEKVLKPTPPQRKQVSFTPDGPTYKEIPSRYEDWEVQDVVNDMDLPDAEVITRPQEQSIGRTPIPDYIPEEPTYEVLDDPPEMTGYRDFFDPESVGLARYP